jgi:hypothetical protein
MQVQTGWHLKRRHSLREDKQARWKGRRNEKHQEKQMVEEE